MCGDLHLKIISLLPFRETGKPLKFNKPPGEAESGTVYLLCDIESGTVYLLCDI